jgi:hypothetical protein
MNAGERKEGDKSTKAIKKWKKGVMDEDREEIIPRRILTDING